MKKLFHILGFLIFVSLNLSSQIDYDEFKKATDKLYIKDVMLYTQPGQSIEYGAIVIENGIITAIGKSIEKPLDARELEVDSLHVYPAFIDALSNTGYKSVEDEKEDKPKVKFPGAPSNKAAGITPEKLATEGLSSSGIKDMRDAGFGISHIVSKGNMLPGQTAIISLSGKDVKDIVIQDKVAMYSQLKSSSGVFPSTMIGVLTKWKELYKQAEGAKKHFDSYKMAPLGMERPAYEDAVQAFIPIVEKKQTVYFKTPKTKDIHRVLSLQKELGFNVVLTDVKQIFSVQDKIKDSNASVLLSLDLPEKEEEEDSEKDESVDEEAQEDTENEAVEEVDEELEKLKARQKEAYNKYIAQAAELEQAGVPFAFSWLKASPKDLHENIRTLIENGLTEEAAISALTDNAAEILGISNIAGTLEKGKLGNLIISNKPYFEEKAKIKYMVVDGEIFEYEIKEKKATEGAEVDMVGTWDYDTEIPGNPLSGQLIIKKEGEEYLVTMTQEGEEDEVIKDVVRDGNNLILNFTVSEQGYSFDVEVDVDFSEEDFEGTISAGDFGSFPMEGSKVSPE